MVRISLIAVCSLFISSAAFPSDGDSSETHSRTPNVSRYRNQQIADRALPAQREAILAVTKFGANVELNEQGSVEAVQLEGCIFPNHVLAELHALPDLKQLKIGHSKINDASLEHLRGLDSLESVTMTQTNITDAGLAHLEGLRGLKSITLHMSLVSDAGMKSLSRIPTLEKVDLENTRVGNEGLHSLGQLKKLTKLLLSRTRVTDQGLVHLSQLSQLEELGLYHNRITDQGLAHLAQLHSLRELDMEGTQITDRGMSSLRELPSLETLNVRKTSVTARGLAQLAHLSRLKRIWSGDHFLETTPPAVQPQLWLASAYGDDVYIYEVGSFTLLKHLVVGPNPHGLSATEDGKTVHVALEYFDEPRGELIWIDTRSFEITGRCAVGPQPQEHECTPDGRWIYVPCGDGHWYVVDGGKKEVVKKIATGGRPHNTVVSPDGRRMYLSPMGYPHAVTIVDIESGHQVVGEIPFGDVTRPPAISADERTFYENLDNLLGFQVADIADRQVVHTVEHAIPSFLSGEWSRSHGLGVRPDQAEIWSCNVEHHLVHIHELSSGQYKELAQISVPGRAYWLSFSPDSKYCFVSIRSKRQVAVIDCQTKQIVRMLDAGRAVKRSHVVEVPVAATTEQ